MSIPVQPNTLRKDVFTRRFYLEQTKKVPGRTGIEDKVSDPPSNFMILGQMPEGVENELIKPYEPVIISGEHWITIDDESNHINSNCVRVYHISEPDIVMKTWGVAMEAITPENAGRILIAGVTWLDTSSITDDLNMETTHLNIIEGELVQGYNGRASILQEMKKPHCLIELSDRRSSLMGRTGDIGIAEGAEGTAFYRRPSGSGWTVTDIEIKAWTDGPDIPPNTNILLVPVEGRFLALEIC
jgi:hypothetical protein